MIGLKKNLNKCGFFGNCDQDLQCMQTKIRTRVPPHVLLSHANPCHEAPNAQLFC